MSETIKRVLPADVYDALELVAEAFGGIGRFSLGSTDQPVCLYGAAAFAVGMRQMPKGSGAVTGPVARALREIGLNVYAVDEAVTRVGRGNAARVPFPELCAELGVERGA